MQDRDWTGTAVAVTALAMTAGVWLWPQAETPRPTPVDPRGHLAMAHDRSAEEAARWRDEARRWDSSAPTIQLSAAAADPAVLR